MTVDMALALGVILGALLLIYLDRYPIEQVALAIPLVLWAAGILTPEEAVSGFSHPATVAIASMLVLGLGLARTGALTLLTRWLWSRTPSGATRRLALLCLAVALVSPFLNNTAVVVIFLPIFTAVARESREPASLFLMPLSFASILGGTVTILGTSTNLIIYGMARQRGLDGLGMFSITPIGLMYLVVGLIYLLTVGQRLLPRREAQAPGLESRYGLRDFLSELRVVAESPAVGKSLAELRWPERHDVQVVGVRHGSKTTWTPDGRTRLAAGDTLYARGRAEALLGLAEAERLATPATAREPKVDSRPRSPGSATRLVELLVDPGSSLVGRTLREVEFRQRYRAVVIGLQRRGRPLPGRLSSARLRPGDLLLVEGPEEALDGLPESSGLAPIGAVKRDEIRPAKALLAAAVLAGVLLVSALGAAPIHTAALAGALVLLFTGCLNIKEAFEEMNWMVVFLIAGLLPAGVAIEKVGAAEWIVDRALGAAPDLGPHLLVLALYLLTSLLTEVMSNNAVAVVMTPVVLTLAERLDANPYALLVTLMLGASASFMTPMGYQTNTLVYGPGGYRFADYLRVGGPLNLLLAGVAALLIPLLWPS